MTHVGDQYELQQHQYNFLLIQVSEASPLTSPWVPVAWSRYKQQSPIFTIETSNLTTSGIDPGGISGEEVIYNDVFLVLAF